MDTPLYFLEDFIPRSRAEKVTIHENEHFKLLLDKQNDYLTSIPFAPWGGILNKTAKDYQSFESFMSEVIKSTETFPANHFIIKQAPDIYPQIVPGSWLEKFGFIPSEVEINQHISLESNIDYHEMEQRKLRKKGNNLTLQKTTEWEKHYDLIAVWREESDIPLNIAASHLGYLIERFPQQYHCWEVKQGDDLLAICITITVTKKHVYYFLPATNPAFKKISPMVFLMDQIMAYFRQKGFSFFDLGQSSIAGIKQEGLFSFKARMGAESLPKITYQYNL